MSLMRSIQVLGRDQLRLLSVDGKPGIQLQWMLWDIPGTLFNGRQL